MIIIYPPLATDLTTGGRYLTPISAVIKEDANGPYELELTHLRDEAGRFAYITCGSVIRCPAPPKSVALSKLITSTVDIYKAVGTAWTKTERVLPAGWTSYVDVVTSGYTNVPIYSTPGGSVIARVAHGARLTYVSTSSAYYSVITRDGISGFVLTSQTAFYATEETAPSVIVDAGAVSAEQLFRVYKISVISPDRVAAYARHISYDSAATKFSSLEATATPLATLLGTLSVNGISFHTTLTDTITETWSNQTAMEIVLDLCETLDAQLVRDNFDVYLLPSGTSEATAQMAVGKNITSMTCETNVDSLITRYIPLISGVEGTAIDSSHIDDYPLPVIDYITADSQGEAETLAAAEFAKGVDLPQTTVDIQFAENETVEVERPIIEYLADSGGNLLYTLLNERIMVSPSAGIIIEYLADSGDNLLYTLSNELIIVNEYIIAAVNTETIELPRVSNLSLFDLIHATDSVMGVDVEVQIVALEYDALREKTNALTIGNVRKRLIGNLTSAQAATSDAIADGAITLPKLDPAIIVPITKGGTGLATVAANSYLKGNGTNALVPRTYSETLADIGAAASGHNHGCPYDIGDVLTTSNATAPATRWPGTTWSAITAGTFLAAAGEGYEAGVTGGEATHVLTVAETAAHVHSLYAAAGGNIPFSAYTAKDGGNTGGSVVNGFDSITASNGSGAAHENRPPYKAYYMWERVS